MRRIIIRRRSFSVRQAVIVGLGIAVLGFTAISLSRAATFSVASESESGTLSGNSLNVSDSTASGGNAVKFGTSSSTGLKYIQGISSNGRYFVDQNGNPILVRGDSPWEIMTDLTPTDAQYYLDNRKSYGVNALIMSLIGSETSGYAANGQTVDGILPFTNGDLNKPNPVYWARMDQYLGMMRDRGMTVFLYLIDGWNTYLPENVFLNKSTQDCYNYGLFVGNRYKDYPNLVWMFGGDYFPQDDTSTPWLGSPIDLRMDAALRGVKDAGNNRPTSIQLGYRKSLSTDDPYWEYRVTWNFVYTYYPTYKAVFDGWNKQAGGANEQPGDRNPRPALFGEGDYENGGTGGGSIAELRRTLLWALTSGSPGSFTGQEDVWDFLSGWKDSLDTTTATQMKKIRDLFDTLQWWTMVPDQQSQFVTAGRGTQVTTDSPEVFPMQNTYATAAISPDGKLAAVYVPSSRTITLNTSKLASGVTAKWYDPSNATSSQTATINASGQVTTPSGSHDGATDWLLLIR